MYRLLFLLTITCSCSAQPPSVIDVAKNISAESMKKNLYALASPEMEGRGIATKGDTMASVMVQSWFAAHGLLAPYDQGRNYFQQVSVNRITAAGSLTVGSVVYGPGKGWMELSHLSVNVPAAPVLMTFYRNPGELKAAAASADVKGKIVLIEGDVFIPMLRDGSIDSVEAIFKKNGAVAVAFYSLALDNDLERQTAGSVERYERPDAPSSNVEGILPEIMLTVGIVDELLRVDGMTAVSAVRPGREPVLLKSSMAVDVRVTKQPATAPNVIGILPGSDPSLPVIIFSAHHDHDGIRNGVLYPGAVDNASGTVAIMEVASLMQQAAKKGLHPKRTIVFASFTGEEAGLLGSFWYAGHPVHSMEKTKAVLNIDMLGRVDTFHAGRRADSNYAYILVKDTVGRGLRKSLVAANHPFVGLDLDPFYEDPKREPRRLMGSDQYPFFLKGVPFVRIDCGFAADYHRPTDTPDKINYDLLKRQTQLVFLTLWNLAND
ncbi:MAG: M28 family peptidase [Chitinophagaceae bacterium]|nr:MAG: M28 family peptidase [Chitinophagaceae bacterium]